MARPDPWDLSEAEIYAMVDSLGDIGADPARMQKIYKSLRLEMVYDNDDRAVDVVIKPFGGYWGVRGASCAHAPHAKRQFRQRSRSHGSPSRRDSIAVRHARRASRRCRAPGGEVLDTLGQRALPLESLQTLTPSPRTTPRP
jgi:hypothetical protein